MSPSLNLHPRTRRDHLAGRVPRSWVRPSRHPPLLQPHTGSAATQDGYPSLNHQATSARQSHLYGNERIDFVGRASARCEAMLTPLSFRPSTPNLRPPTLLAPQEAPPTPGMIPAAATAPQESPPGLGSQARYGRGDLDSPHRRPEPAPRSSRPPPTANPCPSPTGGISGRGEATRHLLAPPGDPTTHRRTSFVPNSSKEGPPTAGPVGHLVSNPSPPKRIQPQGPGVRLPGVRASSNSNLGGAGGPGSR